MTYKVHVHEDEGFLRKNPPLPVKGVDTKGLGKGRVKDHLGKQAMFIFNTG